MLDVADRPLTAAELWRLGPLMEEEGAGEGGAGEGDPGAGGSTEEALTEEVLTASPLEERVTRTGVIVPKKGNVIAEDGTIRIAIIRPTISRGRRLGNPPLPPIYTQQMLGRNAKVFEGWPMFMGHIPPALAARLQAAGRTPADLGGRVIEAWYDPDFVSEEDEEFGYQKGGVLGRAIPYPIAEAIIERDPGALHTSIVAWPSGARPGKAPWNAAVRGMMIEGFRKSPVGSVDFVIRGGAGGRVLSEGEEHVMALVEEALTVREGSGSGSGYPSRVVKIEDLQQMKPGELRAWIQENAEHLVPAFEATQTEGTGGSGGNGSGSEGGITQEALTAALAEFKTELEKGFVSEESVEERANEIVAERETLRERASTAAELIREADGLTATVRSDLTARYRVPPVGLDAPALEAEAVVENGVTTKDEAAVFEQRVKDDIAHAVNVIREAQGKPAVRGQGGQGADAGQGEGAATEEEVREWEDFASEGETDAEKRKEITDGVLEALVD